MKVLIFQYGNYAEAYYRFEAGGAETYRDQRMSVDYVAALAPPHEVTVVAFCEDEHDITIKEGLRSVGVEYVRADRAYIARLLDEIRPDLLICATPHLEVLRQAKAGRIQTFPLFADIFVTTGVRSALRHLLLRMSLSGSHIPGVANHSLNASRSVARCLRYPPAKIVPWDWSPVPTHPMPKARMATATAPTMFFAGSLSADKGVGDCLRALRQLRNDGLDASMSFAGGGDQAAWEAEAKAQGVADAAIFLGLISNEEVRRQMREHDVVVVPSRHSYSEGLPNTIYEALGSRSPLVISDHPAFRDRLTPDKECLVFKAADPTSLADNLSRLCRDPALYAALSSNAPLAHRKLYVGVEWRELMDHILADPANKSAWVERLSLKTLEM